MSKKHLIVAEKGEIRRSRPNETATIIEIGKQIDFDASELDRYDIKGFQPHHYDLLVICAAVEFADRHWKRPGQWERRLEVSVPVIELALWQNPDVSRNLLGALSMLTKDHWAFHFRAAKTQAPVKFRQTPFDFGEQRQFAIAYSEGLDSRAVAALSGPEADALCIRVSGTKQARADGDSYFNRLPFRVRGHGSGESSFRSRGFQFAAITSITAHLANVRRIVVPESGQGALGPAFLPPHGVYRDYRNHPGFFRKMERFLAGIHGVSISFEQPRLWSTKGQTLQAFLQLPKRKKSHLQETRSCWQRRNIVNAGTRKQCGLCAACLLRRMSLHVAGIEEARGTYVVSDLQARSTADAFVEIPREVDRRTMIEYGTAGARHFHHLAQMSTWEDGDLRVHVSEVAAALGATNDETMKNLRNLLKQHAIEWNAFLASQGEESFLLKWFDGGLHD